MKKYAIAIASLLVLSTAQLASALPGQNVSEVESATRKNALWGGKTITEDSIHWGSYAVSTPMGGGELVLYVSTDNGRVTGESLQMRGGNAVSFSRDGGDGLNLVRKAWGDSLVEDFVQSRYTDNIKDVIFKTPIKFYQGQRYGYIVRPGKQFQTFSVMELNDLEKARENTRYCNSTPRPPVECTI